MTRNYTSFRLYPLHITSLFHYSPIYYREEEMQDMNRSTNSKMAWFSFLSLGVCLSVAGLQLWHLKNYFERKKLLWSNYIRSLSSLFSDTWFKQGSRAYKAMRRLFLGCGGCTLPVLLVGDFSQITFLKNKNYKTSYLLSKYCSSASFW